MLLKILALAFAAWLVCAIIYGVASAILGHIQARRHYRRWIRTSVRELNDLASMERRVSRAEYLLDQSQRRMHSFSLPPPDIRRLPIQPYIDATDERYRSRRRQAN